MNQHRDDVPAIRIPGESIPTTLWLGVPAALRPASGATEGWLLVCLVDTQDWTVEDSLWVTLSVTGELSTVDPQTQIESTVPTEPYQWWKLPTSENSNENDGWIAVSPGNATTVLVFGVTRHCPLCGGRAQVGTITVLDDGTSWFRNVRCPICR